MTRDDGHSRQPAAVGAPARAALAWPARSSLWLRANLFATIPSTIITLLLLLVLGKGLVSLVQWGWLNAVWSVPTATTPAPAARCAGSAPAGR